MYQRELNKKLQIDAKRDRLINQFNDMMNNVLNGINVDKIMDVTGFNLGNFTGVRLLISLRGRSTLTQPTIVVNGRQITLPIATHPHGKNNFNDFVRIIVGGSNYPQIVDTTIQAFNQQIPQIQQQ